MSGSPRQSKFGGDSKKFELLAKIAGWERLWIALPLVFVHLIPSEKMPQPVSLGENECT